MVLQFKTAADAKPAVEEFDDLKTDELWECYTFEKVKKSDLTIFKMSEEALKSTDASEIKNARAVIKGKVTSAVTTINALEKDIEGKFDHTAISRTNAVST